MHTDGHKDAHHEHRHGKTKHKRKLNKGKKGRVSITHMCIDKMTYDVGTRRLLVEGRLDGEALGRIDTMNAKEEINGVLAKAVVEVVLVIAHC